MFNRNNKEIFILENHRHDSTQKEVKKPSYREPALIEMFPWTKSRGRVEVGEEGGFSWGGVEGWGGKGTQL